MKHLHLHTVEILARGTAKARSREYEMPPLTFRGRAIRAPSSTPEGRWRHFCFSTMPVQLECPVCGSNFECKPSHASERTYCSRECMASGYESRMKGEGNPNYSNAAQTECDWCGESFQSYQDQRFCSRECQFDFYRETDHSPPTMVGEDNPRWRGGVEDSGHKIRKTPEYRKWRKRVLERDNHTCQLCDEDSGRLHVHHIKPVVTHEHLALWAPNGITLCEECHYGVTGNEGQYEEELFKITGSHQNK